MVSLFSFDFFPRGQLLIKGVRVSRGMLLLEPGTLEYVGGRIGESATPAPIPDGQTNGKSDNEAKKPIHTELHEEEKQPSPQPPSGDLRPVGTFSRPSFQPIAAAAPAPPPSAAFIPRVPPANSGASSAAAASALGMAAASPSAAAAAPLTFRPASTLLANPPAAATAQHQQQPPPSIWSRKAPVPHPAGPAVQATTSASNPRPPIQQTFVPNFNTTTSAPGVPAASAAAASFSSSSSALPLPENTDMFDDSEGLAALDALEAENAQREREWQLSVMASAQPPPPPPPERAPVVLFTAKDLFGPSPTASPEGTDHVMMEDVETEMKRLDQAEQEDVRMADAAPPAAEMPASQSMPTLEQAPPISNYVSPSVSHLARASPAPTVTTAAAAAAAAGGGGSHTSRVAPPLPAIESLLTPPNPPAATRVPSIFATPTSSSAPSSGSGGSGGSTAPMLTPITPSTTATTQPVASSAVKKEVGVSSSKSSSATSAPPTGPSPSIFAHSPVVGRAKSDASPTAAVKPITRSPADGVKKPHAGKPAATVKSESGASGAARSGTLDAFLSGASGASNGGGGGVGGMPPAHPRVKKQPRETSPSDVMIISSDDGASPVASPRRRTSPSQASKKPVGRGASGAPAAGSLAAAPRQDEDDGGDFLEDDHSTNSSTAPPILPLAAAAASAAAPSSSSASGASHFDPSLALFRAAGAFDRVDKSSIHLLSTAAVGHTAPVSVAIQTRTVSLDTKSIGSFPQRFVFPMVIADATGQTDVAIPQALLEEYLGCTQSQYMSTADPDPAYIDKLQRLVDQKAWRMKLRVSPNAFAGTSATVKTKSGVTKIKWTKGKEPQVACMTPIQTTKEEKL